MTKGEQLIDGLLKNPDAFSKRGDDYKLVIECFGDLPVEALRPLLTHSNRDIRRIIVWVVSELGKEGHCLIDEAIGLLCDKETYVRAYALDIVAVCALDRDSHKYVHVLNSLEDVVQLIRVRAMSLICNAAHSQLEESFRVLDANGLQSTEHKIGLTCMLNNEPESSDLLNMLGSHQPLLRKYGAICGWRLRERFPDLLPNCASDIDDDIKRFLKEKGVVAI
jgi:hypothetical protein